MFRSSNQDRQINAKQQLHKLFSPLEATELKFDIVNTDTCELNKNFESFKKLRMVSYFKIIS